MSSTFCQSQDFEELLIRATLIAHADLTDFAISESISLDSVIIGYDSRVLSNSGFNGECVFFQIITKNKFSGESCPMLIVYWSEERRFFRLDGFRHNEFTEFYNFVVKEAYLSSINSQKTLFGIYKRSHRVVLENFYLQDYRLSQLYERHYERSKRRNKEVHSCFDLTRIVEY